VTPASGGPCGGPVTAQRAGAGGPEPPAQTAWTAGRRLGWFRAVEPPGSTLRGAARRHRATAGPPASAAQPPAPEGASGGRLDCSQAPGVVRRGCRSWEIRPPPRVCCAAAGPRGGLRRPPELRAGAWGGSPGMQVLGNSTAPRVCCAAAGPRGALRRPPGLQSGTWGGSPGMQVLGNSTAPRVCCAAAGPTRGPPYDAWTAGTQRWWLRAVEPPGSTLRPAPPRTRSRSTSVIRRPPRGAGHGAKRRGGGRSNHPDRRFALHHPDGSPK